MKKKWADKWIAALRSGKYKQGHGYLQNGDEYCCLGVLCDITEVTRALLPDQDGAEEVYGFGLSGYPTLLPPEVKSLTGISAADGHVQFKRGPLSLVKLNDQRGRSFKQIAAFISRNWKRL